MKKLNIFLISVLLILLTGCAAFFQSKVSMDFDSSGAYIEDLLVEKKVGGQLATPSQVLVSKNLDSSFINITWAAVPYAKAYRIEFASISPNSAGEFPKEITEEQYSVIEESWYNTSYIHEINNSTIEDFDNRYNKRFYYRITALNYREGYTDSLPTPSNIYGKLFGFPLNVRASAGESEDFIEITWDKVDGATKYDIYRSESKDGTGAVFLESVLGNRTNCINYINAAGDKGKEFFYSVYAINREGHKSEVSAWALGYSLVPGAPGKTQIVNISRGSAPDKIDLVWNALPGEGLEYNIFRYSSKDSSLTRVKGGWTDTKFTDTFDLQPGNYYYYMIQATVKDDIGNTLKGPFSDSVEGYILSPPQNINAIKVDGGVKLTWDKAIGSQKEQEKYIYRIFTSNDIKGTFEFHFETDSTQATVGDYAYYKISTKAETIESSQSEPVAPAPNAVQTVSVTRADYSFVNNQVAANDFGVYPVKIIWEKPENDTPYGYYVYRSQNPETGFRRITNDVILENGNRKEYFDSDSSLLPGKVYYYKVLAVNSLEKGINFSKGVYGWGGLTQKQYLKEFNKTVVSSQKKLTLMHKPGSTDKLGTETKNGTLSGTVYYNAAVAGLGAYITMKYTDYSDFYINPKIKELGKIFVLNGNSDTSANMSSNGTMNGTITCTGMYPGTVDYSNIQIKAGAAGGGSYGVTPTGFNIEQVDFAVLEEK